MTKLNGRERDVLLCLFLHGPTWDGNVPSKTGRDELVERGLAKRYKGWQYLTDQGIKLGFEFGFDAEKEKRDSKRRRERQQLEDENARLHQHHVHIYVGSAATATYCEAKPCLPESPCQHSFECYGSPPSGGADGGIE
jgi:hypothetical protein